MQGSSRKRQGLGGEVVEILGGGTVVAPWTLNCDSELTKPPRCGAGAVRDRDTGKRPLWLYWCWNCGEFCARCKWMVWGPAGVWEVEKESESFNFFCSLIPLVMNINKPSCNVAVAVLMGDFAMCLTVWIAMLLATSTRVPFLSMVRMINFRSKPHFERVHVQSEQSQ